MLHVIAELRFDEGRRNEFTTAFQWLEPLVRAEDGCLEYRGALEVHTHITVQDAPRTDTLLVIEKWRDEAALAAHLVAPHMAEFARRVAGIMRDRTIRIARDLG